jgi:hypothetical protein
MVPQSLVVHTRTRPKILADPIRRVIWSLDRDVSVSNVQTMDDILNREVLHRRTEATLLGRLAAPALILACVGIYGVISYLVLQRTQKIGIRIAVGAHPRDIFQTVGRAGYDAGGYRHCYGSRALLSTAASSGPALIAYGTKYSSRPRA